MGVGRGPFCCAGALRRARGDPRLSRSHPDAPIHPPNSHLNELLHRSLHFAIPREKKKLTGTHWQASPVRLWRAAGGRSPHPHQPDGALSPAGSDEGRLAAVFARHGLASAVQDTNDERPALAPDYQRPPLPWPGSLTCGREGGGGWAGGTPDRRRGGFGGADSEAGQAGVARGWPGSCADGPAYRLTHGPTAYARNGAAGPESLAAAADGSGVGFDGRGPASTRTGWRERAHVPMPYVRPRSRGSDRRGSLGGGGWEGLPRGHTDSDEETSGSDSAPPTPSGWSGAAAWARCWRLAPQGADWAAGRGAGAAGGADTERSASTRTFEWEAGGSGSRPGSAADSDRAAGGEGDGAGAETGGPTGAGSERARAGNAGDAVDMALLELSVRCVAEPLLLRMFRISSSDQARRHPA